MRLIKFGEFKVEIPDLVAILEYNKQYLVSSTLEKVQKDAWTLIHAEFEARNTIPAPL